MLGLLGKPPGVALLSSRVPAYRYPPLNYRFQRYLNLHIFISDTPNGDIPLRNMFHNMARGGALVACLSAVSCYAPVKVRGPAAVKGGRRSSALVSFRELKMMQSQKSSIVRGVVGAKCARLGKRGALLVCAIRRSHVLRFSSRMSGVCLFGRVTDMGPKSMRLGRKASRKRLCSQRRRKARERRRRRASRGRPGNECYFQKAQALGERERERERESGCVCVWLRLPPLRRVIRLRPLWRRWRKRTRTRGRGCR